MVGSKKIFQKTSVIGCWQLWLKGVIERVLGEERKFVLLVQGEKNGKVLSISNKDDLVGLKEFLQHCADQTEE